MVVQWLRIRLAVQGCEFNPGLGHEDPMCHEASKPVHCNGRSCVPPLSDLIQPDK